MSFEIGNSVVVNFDVVLQSWEVGDIDARVT